MGTVMGMKVRNGDGAVNVIPNIPCPIAIFTYNYLILCSRDLVKPGSCQGNNCYKNSSESKKLDDNINEFNKLILDLTNTDIEIEDDDQALMGGTCKLKSFICREEVHLKRDSLVKKTSRSVVKDTHGQDSTDDEVNIYFEEALVFAENNEMTELVMDSVGSYHMTHMRDFFNNFKGFNDGPD
ncbi:hypothetical protein Tco_1051194 [Tanacetum coccineum]